MTTSNQTPAERLAGHATNAGGIHTAGPAGKCQTCVEANLEEGKGRALTERERRESLISNLTWDPTLDGLRAMEQFVIELRKQADAMSQYVESWSAPEVDAALWDNGHGPLEMLRWIGSAASHVAGESSRAVDRITRTLDVNVDRAAREK